ncbi:MAG: acyltransferase [Chloroflexi bacterium]|nr:acyltransferase [Chloroflexota bacterium]
MPGENVIATRGGKRKTSPLKPIADFLLRLIRWKVEGDLPDVEKFVLVVAPHTSNWDLPIGFICAHALELLSKWRYGFMAKDAVFKWPLGILIRWMGGIPINRRSPQNVVQQMVSAFEHYDHLMLVITPEGTRGITQYWKSGFYHIAAQAKAPMVLAFLDYKRKVGGLGPIIFPSGDMEADIDIIRKFYASVTAKFPEQFGEIRFKPGDA